VCLKAVNRASRHQTTSNKTDLQQQKLNRTAQLRRKTEFFRKLFSRAENAAKFVPPMKPFSATSLIPAGWQFRIVCHLLKQALLSSSNLSLSPFPARPP